MFDSDCFFQKWWCNSVNLFLRCQQLCYCVEFTDIVAVSVRVEIEFSWAPWHVLLTVKRLRNRLLWAREGNILWMENFFSSAPVKKIEKLVGNYGEFVHNSVCFVWDLLLEDFYNWVCSFHNLLAHWTLS